MEIWVTEEVMEEVTGEEITVVAMMVAEATWAAVATSDEL